jgi:MFS family permease
MSLAITSHADLYGRRLCLLLGSALAIITSIIFIVQDNFYVLVIAAVIGVISPSGSEVGPFMAIEISALTQVISNEQRTKLMGWYNLCGSMATAMGSLTCGLLVYIFNSQELFGYGLRISYKCTFMVYTAIQGYLCYLFYLLDESIEVPPIDQHVKNSNPVSLFLGLHQSKAIVFKLSLLFMMDSFAGSFILQSLISDWFHVTYSTSPATIGAILFICNIVAGISSLFAASLADKIGLIMTMVVTHLPSNVLLILVPLMPTEMLSIIVLCMRFCISQMDVPTRNAYVQGVVCSDERSAANGVTNVVRSVGAATGPLLAGILYTMPATRNYPWYIAGGVKIVYDLLLLWSFKSVKSTSDTHIK